MALTRVGRPPRSLPRSRTPRATRLPRPARTTGAVALAVRAPRAVLAGSLLLVAVVLQVSVLSRLPLPGATPDLVLLAVLGLALARGPAFGLVAGFAGGLLLDVAPPADGALGRWAFVLCVLGYLAGLLRLAARRSALLPLVVGPAGALAALTSYAALGALTGDPRVDLSRIGELAPTGVLYAAVLGPFVCYGVLWLAADDVRGRP